MKDNLMDEFDHMDKEVMADEIIRLRNKVDHQENCIERQRVELTDFCNGKSKSAVRSILEKREKKRHEARMRFPNVKNKDQGNV